MDGSSSFLRILAPVWYSGGLAFSASRGILNVKIKKLRTFCSFCANGVFFYSHRYNKHVLRGESFFMWDPPKENFLSSLTVQPNNGNTNFDELSFLPAFFPFTFHGTKQCLKDPKCKSTTTLKK
jgi:hypothetical protein